MFVKLTSIKPKRAEGWETLKIYQNVEQFVILSRLKNALNTLDHVILYMIVVL